MSVKPAWSAPVSGRSNVTRRKKRALKEPHSFAGAMSLKDISRSKVSRKKKIPKMQMSALCSLPTSKAAAVKPAANRTKALVAIRLGPGAS